MYSVKTDPPNAPKILLLRTNKFFSKKPILQLAVVPELSILVSLSDGGVVSVHDTDLASSNFPNICSIPRSRGANLFALDSSKEDQAFTVRLVVAVKKKLQFYFWKNRKFHELYPDVSLPDYPRSLAWSENSICVGLRNDYILVKVRDTEEIIELFPTGKEANVILLSDGKRFALEKEDHTVFIDLDGRLKLYTVTWSPPGVVDMTHDPPYLLAAKSCGGGVEVKTEGEPRLSVQSIMLEEQAQFIVSGRPGHVFVAGRSRVWCLRMATVFEVLPQLLREKQFELAIALSNMEDDCLSRKKRVMQIQTLHAFDLFCSSRFKESMEMFTTLNIDPSHVIGLFPDLLPSQFRSQLSYPDEIPNLKGRELESATLALIEYLLLRRHHLIGLVGNSLAPLAMTSDCVTVKSRRLILQIIDTTLLKCYLKTNDALVALLLRSDENYCHLEEAERSLKKSQRFAELVIFYNARGLHKKALALLKDHFDKHDSPLKSHLKTVQYLQNLGRDHLDLIFEYVQWVFDVSEKDALTVFTEDNHEVENLPRAKVLEFLLKTAPRAVIPYLRHLILEWKEESPLFHNALILHYKDYIMSFLRSSQPKSVTTPVFQATLAEARRELQELLNSSESYTADLLLSQFPPDSLEQERALLLGRLGRHKEALTIYIYQLRDIAAAMAFCSKHYKTGSDVYSLLLVLMVKPPEASLCKLLSLPVNVQPQCDTDKVLEVLDEFGSKMDLLTILRALPDTVKLKQVGAYLCSRMEEKVTLCNKWQVLKSLKRAEHLQVQEERISTESLKIRLSVFDVCRVCHKRFKDQGAFVRLPGGVGKVVHLSCQDKAVNL